MTEYNIGVDISKSHLDAFRLEDGVAKRFANSAHGFRALSKLLDAGPIARIVYEPTGPYHRAFEMALSGQFPLLKINPLPVRRFAEACGTRAKTDAVDVGVPARMGAVLRLEPDTPVSKKQRDLKDLQVARTGLIKESTRLRNRSPVQINPVLRRQTKARLALVEGQIAEQGGEIRSCITKDREAARKYDILRSVPGIGPVAAALILTFLPEIGSLDRKQAASLAGLAPFTRESGNWKGRSNIRGGRKPLRDALYMPAIVALMRKLLETANALIFHLMDSNHRLRAGPLQLDFA